MTTATLATHGRTMDTETARPRRSLEELVDQLMAAMFPAKPNTAAETAEPSASRSIHEARRLRQAGGDDAGGSVGLLRVDADREAAVRRPGRPGLQPEHGPGRRPGANWRRRGA